MPPIPRTDDILDAVVLAGSRIKGPFAAKTHANLKALLPIKGGPIINQILIALRETTAIDRVCVVGPREVRDASDLIDLWHHDEGNTMADLDGGIESLGGSARRILVCNCDMPFVTTKSIEAMVQRAPIDVEICMPLVTQSDFERKFPKANRHFLHLADGSVAMADIMIVDARKITANLRLLRRLVEHRTSVVGVGMNLGLDFAFRYASGKVMVQDFQERATQVTQCRCRVLCNCDPGLAYDVNNLDEYVDARRRVSRNEAKNSIIKNAAPSPHGGGPSPKR